MTVVIDYKYLKGKYREDFLLRAAQTQEKYILHMLHSDYTSVKENSSEGGKILA